MSGTNGNPPTIDSTPDPTIQTLVYALIRAVLMLLGAIGVSTPAWASQPSSLWAMAGAISLIVGIIWSIVQKFQAAKQTHSAAVASAKLGRPVQTV